MTCQLEASQILRALHLQQQQHPDSGFLMYI